MEPNLHDTSALLLSYDNQPTNKHSNSLFILLRGTAMIQSHSQQTNKNSLFSKILFFVDLFYSTNLSLYNFFLSLLLLIRFIVLLSQAFYTK